MKCLERVAPKKFMGKFDLQKGCKYIGIFMCCVSIICVLAFLTEVFSYQACHLCLHTKLHNAYAFSLHIVVYCLCMLFVNLWFIWGVAHQKAPVVLTWVVITAMWWLQGSSLIFILILLNIRDFGISWIVTLCLAIIAFLIFGYCVLVGYAYWLQIKSHTVAVQDAQNE